MAKIFFRAAVVSSAVTYYVSTTGNDSTGTGSLANPWRTVAHGLSAMAGGDILLLRGGTYLETATSALQPRSGLSWVQPTTVATYPSETAIVQRTNGLYVFEFFGGKQYIVLDHLVLDGTGGNTNSVVVLTDDGTHAPAHIRLNVCEVRNSKNQGIQTFLNSVGLTPTTKVVQDLQILGGSVHDNGDGIFNGNPDTTHEHGLYLQCSGSLIDGVEVHNNAALGIQLYSQEVVNTGAVSTTWCSNNVFRNNYVHDNGRLAGVTAGSTGLLISGGTGNAAYNNVCAHQSVGVGVDYHADLTLVLNNTCYDNRTNYRLGANAQATNVTLTNNVAWRPSSGANTTNNFSSFNASTSTITTSLNLTTGTSGTDPLFVNQAGGDFHLQATSPARDAGASTAPTVTVDRDSIARPQGSAYDIGAYEYH